MRQHSKTPHYLTGFWGVVGSHTPIHWGSRTDGRTADGRRTDGRTDGFWGVVGAHTPDHCDRGLGGGRLQLPRGQPHQFLYIF